MVAFWSPQDEQAEEEREEKQREKLRRLRQNPERRARDAAYSRKWRKANPEKVKAVKRNQYQKHKSQYQERSRKWVAENPERARETRRRINLRKYGLTQLEWDALFERQGRCCAICKTTKPSDKTGWHTDHCHITNMVREILCGHCNRGLGSVKDNIKLLENMIAYLKRHTQ